MVLYCNILKDFSIEDESGKQLTIEDAKQIVESGRMSDCNVGLQRLIEYDWNIDRLKQFYIENP